AEIDIEENADERDAERHNDREPLHRFLQIAEFADPFETIAAWERHVLRDLLLSLQHGTAEIAAAHAKLAGDVALLLLAIDKGSARDQLDLGDVAQGNLHNAVPAGILRADGDAADRLEALAVLRRETHDHRKMAVAPLLENVARRLPPDRS